MENKASELEEWHTSFDAKQRNKNDAKIDSLDTSVQQQLSTNQIDTQQMMKDQRKYLDSNMRVLIGLIQQVSTTIVNHTNQIDSIRVHIGKSSDSPHNERQKHGKVAAAEAEVMESADALQVNRDAHASDPGGVGVS
eukprot:15326072-Ditylum_brightwellii.AAC.1